MKPFAVFMGDDTKPDEEPRFLTLDKKVRSPHNYRCELFVVDRETKERHTVEVTTKNPCKFSDLQDLHLRDLMEELMSEHRKRSIYGFSVYYWHTPRSANGGRKKKKK